MGTEKRNLADTLSQAEQVVSASDGAPRISGSGNSLALERNLLRWVLEQLGSAPLKFVLWDGNEVYPREVVPQLTLHVHDRFALWRLISNPEYEFPEMYVQGRVTLSESLESTLDTIQQARRKLHPNSLQRRISSALRRPRSGSLTHARENIQSHYDLGNDFYRLWLDEQMVYTCAYFPNEQASLEAAQTAKLDLVCRKLWLKPGEQVVEAGCGWGALALHMARNFGVYVRAQSPLAKPLLNPATRERMLGDYDGECMPGNRLLSYHCRHVTPNGRANEHQRRRRH